MKLLTLVLCTFIAYRGGAQSDIEPWITYKVETALLDSKTDNWKYLPADYSPRIYIFFLDDRIRIKDKVNSVYYTHSKCMTEDNDDYHSSTWKCYDEKGKDCFIAIRYYKSDFTTTVSVTYSDILYLYSVRHLKETQ